MNTIRSINPANGEIIGETLVTTEAEIQTIISKARRAFPSWRALPVEKRADFARKLIPLIEKNAEKIAGLMTTEMGKPIRESREEIAAELGFINWYIKYAGKALGETIVREDSHTVYKTVYEPWGVCASIAPWNFPISMASTGITAQLLAGNTVIFKPSEYTTLTQKLFVDLFNETGLPQGVLQYIVGAGNVGATLIAGDIDFVWFTGSTKVGQEIYKKCAEKFIKPLLELGGSSPAVIFSDCDFDKTVDAVYSGRFYNNGQVCNAIKRAFIERSLYKKFVAAMKAKLETQTVGDPMGGADFGPLVSRKQLDLLISQVESAKKDGATIITGGDRPKGSEYADGNYYLPTILTDIAADMRVFAEEVFGPVLVVVPFDTEDESVRMANHTPYGLTAEIFTRDSQKANRVASQVLAGGVAINMDFAFVPDCPVGGYKKSGLGREYGFEGFRELAQLKYICAAK